MPPTAKFSQLFRFRHVLNRFGDACLETLLKNDGQIEMAFDKALTG